MGVSIMDYLTRWIEELYEKYDRTKAKLDSIIAEKEEQSAHRAIIINKTNDSYQIFTPNKQEDANNLMLKKLDTRIKYLETEEEKLKEYLRRYEQRINELKQLRENFLVLEEKNKQYTEKSTEVNLEKEELEQLRDRIKFCIQISNADIRRCKLELENIVKLFQNTIDKLE